MVKGTSLSDSASSLDGSLTGSKPNKEPIWPPSETSRVAAESLFQIDMANTSRGSVTADTLPDGGGLDIPGGMSGLEGQLNGRTSLAERLPKRARAAITSSLFRSGENSCRSSHPSKVGRRS